MWKQLHEGANDMRRTMLVVTSAGMGGILLVFFCVSVIWQCVQVQAQELPPVVMPFPCDIVNSDMKALRLVRYEGPFWEDDSEAEVVDVAALVIENTGGYIAEGAVVLEWGEERMVFELYDLPPGERILVLEKDRQRFRRESPTGCYGWEMEAYPETTDSVTVEDAGGMWIAITNHTDSEIPVARVCYKTCDPGSGMFIGGISYSAEVRNLQPGERRLLSPYHYASGSSKVVQVIMWTE